MESSTTPDRRKKSPWPWVAGGVGVAAILGIIFWPRKSQAADGGDAAPNGPTTQPVVYVPTSNPQPTVHPSAQLPATTRVYTIKGDATDSGVGWFLSSWFGNSAEYNDDRVLQLAAVNPSLRHQWNIKARFIQSGPAGDIVTDYTSYVTQDSPDLPMTDVNPDTQAGTDFGQNPTPGFSGRWEQQSEGPALTPWTQGAQITIPASWPDPANANMAANVAAVASA